MFFVRYPNNTHCDGCFSITFPHFLSSFPILFRLSHLFEYIALILSHFPTLRHLNFISRLISSAVLGLHTARGQWSNARHRTLLCITGSQLSTKIGMRLVWTVCRAFVRQQHYQEVLDAGVLYAPIS